MARNMQELEAFQDFVFKTDALKLIIDYVDSPTDEAKYNLMKAKLESIIADPALLSIITRVAGDTPRLVIGNADCNIIFDSSRINSTNTTQQNALANAGKSNSGINDNHYSRPSFSTAMLSKGGVGSQIKLSSTTGKFETRLCYRVGKSSTETTAIVAASFSVPK